MGRSVAESLIKRYHLGQCTEKERALVEAGFLHEFNNATEEISKEEIEQADLRMQAVIKKHINAPESPWQSIFKRSKVAIAIAASLVVVGSTGFYFLIWKKDAFNDYVLQYKNDIKPGGNKAILTLADGKKISLTDASNGDLVKTSGIAITKTASGQLVYTIAANDQTDDTKLNTISTPKGGQWQVHLPDGSNVWLNASSSLTYPLSFAALKERKVQLTGEAYFEIAKDKLHPFIVHTQKQDVKVLGTHFNISSYEDDWITRTTLLEGSVSVSVQGHGTEILKPGEQSQVSLSGIQVQTVDVDESVAWKNGYFMFNNDNQETVMRKLSRWYNVEVEYADESSRTIKYYGTVSRFDNIAKVLRKLEQTSEARFEIDGNKIKVYKEKKK